MSMYVVLVIALLGAPTTTTTTEQQVATPITKWHAKFTPDYLETRMGTKVEVLLEVTNADTTHLDYYFQLLSGNPRLATVDYIIPAKNIDPNNGSWRGNVSLDVLFLGGTSIYVELVNSLTNATERSNSSLQLTILRQMRVVDHVFTISVALLVSLLYINFGAALDLNVLHRLITQPVGPLIGLTAQCFIMPLLSYALGYLIFPDSVEMQLGLFFTGVSPGGGASNIWSVVLGGNINLSVLMTTVSNFAAFGIMPLWIFTLGYMIFERGNMQVPYAKIAMFAFSLIVPLGIGVGIQKCSLRLTRVLVRLLKPISTCLILFIVIFAIVTNLYLFELFSWQIAVAGLALPWLGYISAWFVAKALRQNTADALTIAIETAIQNTGISIFLLRYSLPQPQADLTTVIPVAVAIMTPLPLLAVYIYKRCNERVIENALSEEQYIMQQHVR